MKSNIVGCHVSIHAQAVNMMEGLDETKENNYFNNNPKIIPLFKINILQTLTSYVEDKQSDIPIDDQTMKEIRLQQEATEKK